MLQILVSPMDWGYSCPSMNTEFGCEWMMCCVVVKTNVIWCATPTVEQFFPNHFLMSNKNKM